MAERPPATVLIALGSNIEPRTNLPRALAELEREFEVEAVSGVWKSAPYGAPGTPPFHNAAVRLACRLSPSALKRRLRRIEAGLGRRRTADRNAPRPIDLDIALYADLVIDDPAAGLRIPDPDVLERAYLALPLAEAGPRVVHPESGEALTAIAARLAGGPEPPRRVARRLVSAAVAGF